MCSIEGTSQFKRDYKREPPGHEGAATSSLRGLLAPQAGRRAGPSRPRMEDAQSAPGGVAVPPRSASLRSRHLLLAGIVPTSGCNPANELPKTRPRPHRPIRSWPFDIHVSGGLICCETAGSREESAYTKPTRNPQTPQTGSNRDARREHAESNGARGQPRSMAQGSGSGTPQRLTIQALSPSRTTLQV